MGHRNRVNPIRRQRTGSSGPAVAAKNDAESAATSHRNSDIGFRPGGTWQLLSAENDELENEKRVRTSAIVHVRGRRLGSYNYCYRSSVSESKRFVIRRYAFSVKHLGITIRSKAFVRFSRGERRPLKTNENVFVFCVK